VRWTKNTHNNVAVKQIPGPSDIPAHPFQSAVDTQWKRVVVTTSHEIPGRRLIEHRGEVFGITVRTRNMFSDFGAGVRNLVGGEVGAYTKMLTTARHEALQRLRQEAHGIGANAVISMRMTANSLSDAVTEVVAYGAAVSTEPQPSVSAQIPDA
jgi:uncharacterized protein YbjQ (UPF0145 family)